MIAASRCRLPSPWIPIVLLVLAVVGVSGCGGRKFQAVTGKVTYNQKPLEPGCALVFTCDKLGVALTAPLEDDGTFVVANTTGYGLEPGHYKVSVILPKDFYQNVKDLTQAQYQQKLDNFVPSKYIIPATSGLEIDVTDQPVKFIVDLKK